MLSKCMQMRQCSSRGRCLLSTFHTNISSMNMNVSNTILTNSSSRNKLLFTLVSQPLPVYHHSSPFALKSTYGRRGFSSTTKEEEVNRDENVEQVEGEPIKPDEVVTPPASDDNAKIEQLEKEVKDMKDKVLRALAEEENVRRIAKRDIDNAKVVI